MFQQAAAFDAVRSIGQASLSGSFTNFGSALPYPGVSIFIQNNTNGDVIISQDGVNSNIYLLPNSFRLYDIRTNAQANGDFPVAFSFPAGTQFQIKQGTSVPTSGTVYMEVLLSKTL